jgi:hypothetical protein
MDHGGSEEPAHTSAPSIGRPLSRSTTRPTSVGGKPSSRSRSTGGSPGACAGSEPESTGTSVSGAPLCSTSIGSVPKLQPSRSDSVYTSSKEPSSSVKALSRS